MDEKFSPPPGRPKFPFNLGEHRRISDHIKSHSRGCSFCGHPTFALTNTGMVLFCADTPTFPATESSITDETFPVIAAVCAKCSHVDFFSWLSVLGGGPAEETNREG